MKVVFSQSQRLPSPVKMNIPKDSCELASLVRYIGSADLL